jgi:hypothetical protein
MYILKMSDKKNVKYVTIKKDNTKNYKKKPKEYLSETEVKKRLQNCIKVKKEDVGKMEVKTKIKYVEETDKGYILKNGGSIVVNSYPDYLIVKNGSLSWSVQLNKNTIYREITINELKDYYENIIYEKDKTILHYRNSLELMKNKYNSLKDKIKSLN